MRPCQRFTALLPKRIPVVIFGFHQFIHAQKEFKPQEYLASASPRLLRRLSLNGQAQAVLTQENEQQALNLSAKEIEYLAKYYQANNHQPTDAELVMFSQANSEHCRHKIFNARWHIDDKLQPKSLFDMIRNTSQQSPQGILLAYHDNAAAIQASSDVQYWYVNPLTRSYNFRTENMAITMKVETHNHPTAIAPFPGAATGSGGEIRDEVATGRGGYSKAGFCGYSVSLDMPGDLHSGQAGSPLFRDEIWGRIASPRTIMEEAPIGAARFNNEFGRPCLGGYFRTLQIECQGKRYGYHKPIMLAGGYGAVQHQHLQKKKFSPSTPIVVLGGPALLIGLGGGAASSQTTGSQSLELDFASVQRSNPEMQRLCQEVINQCIALGDNNPILSIHDVGAGGLSNAIPELLHDAQVGGTIDLSKIPIADLSMSPMEIWSNEAQERYVIALEPEQLHQFIAICKREACPYAIIGEATQEERLVLNDHHSNTAAINMPLSTLLDEPKALIDDIKITSSAPVSPQDTLSQFDDIDYAVQQVLRFPSVASKQFLLTICDRSVGGLTARDPMVGPWQVPVADCGITASDFLSTTGEAFAIGERSPVAIISPAASARLAVSEAITNILAVDIDKLSDIKLSANWMSSCADASEYAALYDAVQAIGEHFCPQLGIAIPVGKDSLSMRVHWQQGSPPERAICYLAFVTCDICVCASVRC